MTSRLRRFVLLAFATLSLAAFASVASEEETVYTVRCRYYYQDASVLANPSVEFVTPIGFLGKYFPGDTVIFGCSPTKIPTLECARGYYVSGWDLDRDWGDNMPGIGGFTPVHRRQYGAGSLLPITFSSSEIGEPAPTTCELVPHIAMMHYTLAYDANGGTFNGTAPAKAEYLYSTEVTSEGSVCSREGYTFTSWNTRKDGTGVTVAFDQTVNGDTFSISSHLEAITLYAQWQANDYSLRLRPGKGIAEIHYLARSSGEATSSSLEWRSTTTDLDVPVAYDTEWKAYATAKPGYTYTATSATNPKTGTMKTDGASFEPNASAGSISLSFNGNGSTGGFMSDQSFIVDEGKYLSQNQFSRGYTVAYDAKGGSSCAQGTATYPFKNWNNEEDGSGLYTYSDQQMVTNPCGSTGAAKMLYAQWDTTKITPVVLPSTSKTGSSFSGWYSDYTCSPQSKVGKAGDPYTPTNNTTLFAGWDTVTYTVTFYDDDPDGGGSVKSQQEVEYGQSAVEPNHPTKKYYKFSSWNTAGWKNVTGTLKVWPIWTGKQYWLRVWKNYSDQCAEFENSIEPCGIELATKSLTMGDPWLDYSIEDKVGHVFDYWAVNREGTGYRYDKTSSVTYKVLDTIGAGSEQVDFYAIWSPNSYKVRFDGNGATGGTMPDQDFTYDVAQALTPNGFTREGQTFLRWEDAASHRVYEEKAVVSNLTATADAIVTLQAVWSNYHYVRFDRNGATNETEMALQTFLGAATNALSANAYGKVGYTFAGWATNAVSATNLVVTYTNCQAASFPLAQANETNTLYAVWATNRYTIAFDPGTDLKRPYFFGMMAPLTNCAYDTVITIQCGYTNYCSKGLLGWSKTRGATVPEYNVMATSPVTQGSDAVLSNVTAEANGSATLYAVWEDEGDLSKAAGLQNAVLVGGDWSVSNDKGMGGRPCVITETTASGTHDLTMKVFGPGTLRFSWLHRGTGTTKNFKMKIGSDPEITISSAPDGKWHATTNQVELVGEGLISFFSQLSSCSMIDIRLDDISWTPGAELKPGEEMPTYETQEAAEAAAATARVAPPNDEVAAVVSAEDYNALFDVRAVQMTPSANAAPLLLAATPDAGEWTLAIQLKPSVSNEVQAVLDVAETNLCSVITNNPISVSFAMKAGLYYGLAATNEVEWLHKAVPANWVLGDGKGGQSVSADRPSDTAAYYELRMAVNSAP